MSTDTALLHFVDAVESTMLRNIPTVAVFLDISSAFDNVSIQYASTQLGVHGVPEDAIAWYMQYANNRYCVSEVKGVHKIRQVTRGTSQGGVISTIIWSVILDGLLDILDKSGVQFFSYADDLAILHAGPNVQAICKDLQRVLDQLEIWGRQTTLSFSPQKSKTMLFSRDYNSLCTLPVLRLGSSSLQRVYQFRYLGLLFDSALSWHPHITQKILVTKRLLFLIKSTIGSQWGPQPKMIKWVETAVLQSKISYGAVLWANASKSSWALQQFKRLHRLFLLSLGHFRRSTPTDGLEIIFGTPHTVLIFNKTVGILFSDYGHCNPYLKAGMALAQAQDVVP